MKFIIFYQRFWIKFYCKLWLSWIVSVFIYMCISSIFLFPHNLLVLSIFICIYCFKISNFILVWSFPLHVYIYIQINLKLFHYIYIWISCKLITTLYVCLAKWPFICIVMTYDHKRPKRQPLKVFRICILSYMKALHFYIYMTKETLFWVWHMYYIYIYMKV